MDINKLTLKEKVCQMVFPSLSYERVKNFFQSLNELKIILKSYPFGGFIVFYNNVPDFLETINLVQTESSIPLLIASDIESGVGQIVNGTTFFPNNMALGATNNPEFTYLQGKITAIESRAIGINMAFAPVVDVNNNPDNPIINVRSYGEDVNLVCKMSSAFIKGCKENGLLTTAKHFPGHGDTNVDSHLRLPIINADMNRLNKIELLPFKSSIKAGVDAIMTAHIAIPKLEENEEIIPATISYNIMTKLLRNELGFNGLIVTDALIMNSIVDEMDFVQAAVKAIKAGCDIILVPPDPILTVDGIVNSVVNNDLDEELINQSVKRIFQTKEKIGLFDDKNIIKSMEDIKDIINKEEFHKFSALLSEQSITLVQDKNHLIPITEHSKIINIVINDDNLENIHKFWTKQLDDYSNKILTFDLNPSFSVNEIELIVNQINNFDIVLCPIFSQIKTWNPDLSLNDSLLALLKEIVYKFGDKTIMIAMSNPYLLSEFPDVSTYICTYSYSPYSIIAVMDAIWGEIPFKGKLPISIPGLYKIGHSWR